MAATRKKPTKKERQERIDAGLPPPRRGRPPVFGPPLPKDTTPSIRDALFRLRNSYHPKNLFVCDKETPWKPEKHLPCIGPRWEVDHVHALRKYIGSGWDGLLCWVCGARWVEWTDYPQKESETD